MVLLLVLTLALLALGAGLAVAALTRRGRSIRSQEPLQGNALRLFTTAVFILLPGVFLAFGLLVRDVGQRF
jgi:predicted permease